MKHGKIDGVLSAAGNAVCGAPSDLSSPFFFKSLYQATFRFDNAPSLGYEAYDRRQDEISLDEIEKIFDLTAIAALNDAQRKRGIKPQCDINGTLYGGP